MKPLRIVVVANPQAVHTRRWSQSLAELGHRVVVIGVRRADIPGVEVVSMIDRSSASAAGIALGYLLLVAQLRRHVRRLQPDAIMAHYTTTNGVVARITRVRPLLMVPWGTDIRPESGRWTRIVRDRVNRWVLRRVDRIAVSSHYLAERVRAVASPLETHVSVVPFGVDTTHFAPRTDRPGDGPLTIGFVKHFRPRYGTGVLLEAMPHVLEHVPSATLTLAGSGPLEAELRELAASLGITDVVRFVGRVAHDEVPDLMASFDVLVNPSLEESFGVVLLEGSAMGLPVVSSDVGGVREVVDEGVTGELVPPGDSEALGRAIVRLGTDESLRRRMGAAGRARVLAEFAWERNVDQMNELIEAMVNDARSDDERQR